MYQMSKSPPGPSILPTSKMGDTPMPPLMGAESDDDSDEEVEESPDLEEDTDASCAMRRRIRESLERGATWHRTFLRGFGALRTETHLAQVLSVREKTHLLALWTKIPTKTWKGGKQVKHGPSVSSLLWDFGVRDKKIPMRILNNATERCGNVGRLVGKKRKLKIVVEKLDDVLETQVKETTKTELHDRYNNLPDTAEVGYSTFLRSMKKNKVIGKKRKVTSTLLPRHMIGRMIFATYHLRETNILRFHGDESIFHTHDPGRGKVFCSPRMDPEFVKRLTTLPLQSKRHITWEMIITVVGLPMPRINFKGNAFSRHVCMPHTQKKDGNHKKGVRHDRKCKYDHEFHIIAIKELLARFPLLFKGFVPDWTTIYVLMDGAGPHYHEQTQKRISKLGRMNIPRVVFQQQTAQSCLFNWNDLFVYNSLKAKKNRRDYRGSAEVVAAAKAAFDNMDAATLIRGISFGKIMMAEVLRQGGGYVGLKHTGLTKAQKNGDLDAFVTEYLDKKGCAF